MIQISPNNPTRLQAFYERALDFYELGLGQLLQFDAQMHLMERVREEALLKLTGQTAEAFAGQSEIIFPVWSASMDRLPEPLMLNEPIRVESSAYLEAELREEKIRQLMWITEYQFFGTNQSNERVSAGKAHTVNAIRKGRLPVTVEELPPSMVKAFQRADVMDGETIAQVLDLPRETFSPLPKSEPLVGPESFAADFDLDSYGWAGHIGAFRWTSDHLSRVLAKNVLTMEAWTPARVALLYSKPLKEGHPFQVHASPLQISASNHTLFYTAEVRSEGRLIATANIFLEKTSS